VPLLQIFFPSPPTPFGHTGSVTSNQSSVILDQGSQRLSEGSQHPVFAFVALDDQIAPKSYPFFL